MSPGSKLVHGREPLTCEKEMLTFKLEFARTGTQTVGV